jgi:LysR family hydrogen peroxide-inducible transcriptional activator
MNIDFFSEFLTLSETQNFGVAAEHHYISIATLTRHMHFLEEQFHSQLFYRQGNRSLLTKAGKSLIPYAQTIVSARNDYMELVTPYQTHTIPHISIAAAIPLSFYGMTDLMGKYHHTSPEDLIDVSMTSVQEAEEGIHNHRYDFAVLWHLDNLPYNLTSCAYKHIDIAALVPRNHPLASKSLLYLTDLKDIPLLFLNNISSFYKQLICDCQKLNFTPRIRATVNCGKNIEALVYAGFGIGLLPVDTSIHLSPEIVNIPIFPQTEISLDIVYDHDTIGDRPRSLIQFLLHTT